MIIETAQIKPSMFGNEVLVRFEGGEGDDPPHLLMTYYPDELTFTASEFIGLTKEQALRLFHDKDVAYLRS